MAFTSRSERRFGLSGLATPNEIGPGTYIGNDAKQAPHAYAPFLSTTKREIGQISATKKPSNPGPGSYINDATQSRQPASSNAFVSKVNRFTGMPSQDTPGPGTYQFDSAFVVSQKKVSSPSKSLVADPGRSQSAPSIPAGSQSYGYEERDGLLIRQGPPKEGFSGDKGDHAGPGYYNPSFNSKFNRAKGAINWERSKADRTAGLVAAQRTDGPGPGQYDTSGYRDPEFEPEVMPSSNFASTVPRAILKKGKEDDTSPGPGSYELSSLHAKRVPEVYQFFGSRSQRFDGSAPQLRSRIPGPGSYDGVKSTFDQLKRSRQDRKIPFASTTSRFDAHRLVDEKPGPGDYEGSATKTVVDTVSSKVVGRKGIFGSTAERFRELPTTLNPGPGSYEEMSVKPIRRVKGRQTWGVFASSTGRDLKNITGTSDYPPPGAYEAQDQFKKRPQLKNTKETIFLSSAPRIGTDKALDVSKGMPGPGTYNPGSFTHQFRPKVGEKPSPFLSKETRFSERGHFKTPGPGSYAAVSPEASLVKRSFNVTIEGTM